MKKFELPNLPVDEPAREEFDLKKLLEQANAFINQADGLITAAKLWENPAEKIGKIAESVTLLLRAVDRLAPFLPQTVVEIKRQLTTLDPKPLFPRLEK